MLGTGELIKARGPDAWESEYEKSMLASQICALALVATLSNEPCFLEQKPWQKVLETLACDTNPLKERGQLTVRLWQITASLSGLSKRVADLILGDTRDQAERHELRIRAFTIRDYLLDLATLYDDAIQAHPEEAGSSDKRFRIQSMALIKRLRINRLIVALCPSAIGIEEETQRLATQAQELVAAATAAGHHDAQLFGSQVVLAQAIIRTKDEWRESCMSRELNPQVPETCISKQVFKNWLTALATLLDPIKESYGENQPSDDPAEG